MGFVGKPQIIGPEMSHARKLQNLFAGNSKNELAVEVTAGGTTRTADTNGNNAFQSSGGSGSVKESAGHKIAISKPPRDGSVNKVRPSTTSSAAFRFYHYQNPNSHSRANMLPGGRS